MPRTHEICTSWIRTAIIPTAARLLLLGLFAAAGCTQEERRTTARSAAQVATASVTATATGQSTTRTTRSRRFTGIKPDGHGGFDSSEAQRAALAQAEFWSVHNNDVIKPFLPTLPATRPTAATVTPFGGR